jgi:diacylglycerol kinase (ATP)
MPLRQWVKSANYAINGILHAARTQRHMRYHLYASILVLLLSFLLGIGRGEFLLLVVLAIIVLSTEMVNTALEEVVNILFEKYDKRAMAIKDVAAGAVLISALGAAIIGYIILFVPLKNLFQGGLEIAKNSEANIAVLALIIVLALVVILKAFFGRGMPLKGGMPSGHAAVSFAVWIAVTLISENFVVSLLVLTLAVVIAQSRLTTGVHRAWEVILGAVLGMAVMFVLFKVFI